MEITMNESQPQSTFSELVKFLYAYDSSIKMDINDTIELTRSFLYHNPMWHNEVRALYGQAMNLLGKRDLANKLACLVVETIEKIAENGEKIADIPLCFNEWATIHRIGETIDQSAYVLALQKLGVLKEKPLFCQDASIPLSNKALIPYLKDCWEIITDPTDVAYFKSVAKFRPLSTFLYKYSDTQYGHSGDFFSDCCSDLIQAGINPSFFTLKDITIDTAMKFLKPFGLKKDDAFVVMHLREESAHLKGGIILSNDIWHLNRNTKVENFISSVDYLLNMGLKVIRIGNKNMTPMIDKKGFIDLTRLDRPEEVDIFLCGAAAFYFGSPSGPYSIANQFGTKCCVVDYATHVGTRINDFTQFLHYKKLDTGKTYTFSEMEDANLVGIFSNYVFNDRGLVPKFSTASENLQLTTEMIEYLDEGSIFNLNREYQKAKEEKLLWGGICSRSLGFLKLNKNDVSNRTRD